LQLLLERARIFATDSLFVKPFPCYINDVRRFYRLDNFFCEFT
jgi:hypothetical protein